MSNKNSIILTTIANILEWVDYALYGGFVFVISQTFFPHDDCYLNTIYAYLIFAFGFISRPIGGIIFGHIADKIKREKALLYSVVLMSVATTTIGVLPDYNTIGWTAPLLLLLCRLLQGIAIGGEYTGAMVHMVENAPNNKRGLIGSFAEMGCLAGTFIGGSFFCAILEYLLSHENFFSWGWRIPFVISSCGVFLAYKLQESIHIEPSPKKKEDDVYIPILDLVKQYKKICCYTALSSAFSGVNFYTILVFIPNYLVTNNHFSVFKAFGWSGFISILMMMCCILGGVLSDKYTRKGIIIPAIISMILLVYPMMLYVGTTRGMVYQMLSGICLALYFGGRPAFFAEAFPKKLRCTAVSLCLSLSHAIFAGTTSVLATYVTNKFGHPACFAWYIILISILALFGFSQIKDKTGESME